MVHYYLQALGFDDVFKEKGYLQILRDNIENAKELIVGNYHIFVICIDNCIELWYKTTITDNKITLHNFSTHYNTRKRQKILNPEWVYDDEDGAILLFDLNDDFLILNAEIIDKFLVKEMDFEKTYEAQLVCFADTLEIFKSEALFHTKHANMSIKSLIPIGTMDLKESQPLALLYLNGVVKSINRKINSFTGIAYYHLVVDSIDSEFDILVSKELVEGQLEINDIISTICWLSGRMGDETKAMIGTAHSISIENMNTTDFIELVESPMKTLQDRPGEHLVINFEIPEKMGGIVFIQSARYGDCYLIEIGKYNNEEYHLYRLDELYLNKAIQIFYDVCVLKEFPDLSTWKDMTKEILKK